MRLLSYRTDELLKIGVVSSIRDCSVESQIRDYPAFGPLFRSGHLRE